MSHAAHTSSHHGRRRGNTQGENTEEQKPVPSRIPKRSHGRRRLPLDSYQDTNSTAVPKVSVSDQTTPSAPDRLPLEPSSPDRLPAGQQSSKQGPSEQRPPKQGPSEQRLPKQQLAEQQLAQQRPPKQQPTAKLLPDAQAAGPIREIAAPTAVSAATSLSSQPTVAEPTSPTSQGVKPSTAGPTTAPERKNSPPEPRTAVITPDGPSLPSRGNRAESGTRAESEPREETGARVKPESRTESTARAKSDTARQDITPAAQDARPGEDDPHAHSVSEAKKLTSYRPELQGLRAVAIMMVVCYHIWFGRVSGGVDIFLLISAFLLTGSFTRKLERGTPLRVPRYWLHAFKRLVPPGALVILLTVIAMFFTLPGGRWRDILDQALASLLYVENWLLAANSVDYYASDHSLASPLQNFWSLSIQGQVFLLWPALFLIGALLIRWFHLPVRRTLFVLFGAVFAGSFAWSVYFTATDQVLAYFDTRTRLWEFALGSLLALALPLLERRWSYRLPSNPSANGYRIVRALLGWIGLALILACGWVLDIEGAFPGYVALWPTLAACLVIAAGPTKTWWGVDRLLASKPLQWLGDISYALYLVHWPALVILLTVLEVETLSPLVGTALVIGAIVMAWAITRWVDSPIRYSSWADAHWWRSVGIIGVSFTIVFVTTATATEVLDRNEARLQALASKNNPGAVALNPTFRYTGDPHAELIPQDADLPHNWVSLPENCTGTWAPDSSEIAGNCSQLPGQEGKPTIMVVGNSRAQQFAGSVIPIAQANGFTVISLFQGGCAFGTGTDAQCPEWSQAVENYILKHKPNYLMTTTTLVPLGGGEETITPGIEGNLHEIMNAGISVVGLRDAPRLPFDPYGCLQENSANPAVCVVDTSSIFAAKDPNQDLTHILDSATQDAVGTSSSEDSSHPRGRFLPVDLTPSICPQGKCELVIGNVRVYLDPEHLTADYTRTLALPLTDALAADGVQWK